MAETCCPNCGVSLRGKGALRTVHPWWRFGAAAYDDFKRCGRCYVVLRRCRQKAKKRTLLQQLWAFLEPSFLCLLWLPGIFYFEYSVALNLGLAVLTLAVVVWNARAAWRAQKASVWELYPSPSESDIGSKHG